MTGSHQAGHLICCGCCGNDTTYEFRKFRVTLKCLPDTVGHAEVHLYGGQVFLRVIFQALVRTGVDLLLEQLNGCGMIDHLSANIRRIETVSAEVGKYVPDTLMRGIGIVGSFLVKAVGQRIEFVLRDGMFHHHLHPIHSYGTVTRAIFCETAQGNFIEVRIAGKANEILILLRKLWFLDLLVVVVATCVQYGTEACCTNQKFNFHTKSFV